MNAHSVKRILVSQPHDTPSALPVACLSYAYTFNPYKDMEIFVLLFP